MPDGGGAGFCAENEGSAETPFPRASDRFIFKDLGGPSHRNSTQAWLAATNVASSSLFLEALRRVNGLQKP
jgi:hypothetical protein